MKKGLLASAGALIVLAGCGITAQQRRDLIDAAEAKARKVAFAEAKDRLLEAGLTEAAADELATKIADKAAEEARDLAEEKAPEEGQGGLAGFLGAALHMLLVGGNILGKGV